MKATALELHEIVTSFADQLQRISDDDFCAKPLQHQWSKKEIVGHLIDSAHNNIRRFIVAQYEPAPPHIVYEQDFWVEINHYQQAAKDDVILLWKLLNIRLSAILTATPEENYSRHCNTGKTAPELHPLQWLATDYVRHLKHHLNQIIPSSFV